MPVRKAIGTASFVLICRRLWLSSNSASCVFFPVNTLAKSSMRRRTLLVDYFRLYSCSTLILFVNVVWKMAPASPSNNSFVSSRKCLHSDCVDSSKALQPSVLVVDALERLAPAHRILEHVLLLAEGDSDDAEAVVQLRMQHY